VYNGNTVVSTKVVQHKYAIFVQPYVTSNRKHNEMPRSRIFVRLLHAFDIIHAHSVDRRSHLALAAKWRVTLSCVFRVISRGLVGIEWRSIYNASHMTKRAKNKAAFVCANTNMNLIRTRYT